MLPRAWSALPSNLSLKAKDLDDFRFLRRIGR